MGVKLVQSNEIWILAATLCSFSFPEPSFLLVTWSAKRRALVAATTGCREISDIR